MSWALALVLVGTARAQTVQPAASPTNAALEAAPSNPDATFDGSQAKPPCTVPGEDGPSLQDPKKKYTIPEAQWGVGGAKPAPCPKCPKPEPPKKDPWWMAAVGLASIGLGAGLGAWLFGPWGAVGGALLLPLVVGLVIGLVKTFAK